MEASLITSLRDLQWTLERYIVVSTVTIIFLSSTIAQVGFDLALGYPVILMNLLLLLIGGRLAIHPFHVAILGAVAIVSFMASLSSSTPFNAILSQISGIAVISTYYLSVLSRFPVSVISWMELYGKFALAVSIYGIFAYLFLQHPGMRDYDRLHSFYSEPSFYIYATLPALGYYLSCYLRDRSHRWESLLLLGCYLLSQSSLGLLGLALVLMFQFHAWLKSWKSLLAIPGVIGLLVAAYLVIPGFRLRVNDTFFAISAADIADANASTLALLSNAYVALRTFLTHPLIGVGIGGYQYAYPAYIGDIMQRSSHFWGLNMYDAASLYFRIAAEMGILGIIAFVTSLVWLSRVKGAPFEQIRNAIVPYILIRAFRFGAYFSVELFFFVGLYILNYLNYRASRPKSAAPSPAPTTN